MTPKRRQRWIDFLRGKDKAPARGFTPPGQNTGEGTLPNKSLRKYDGTGRQPTTTPNREPED